MNCTSCKNPNNSNAAQCEWCGYSLINSNEKISDIDRASIKITLSFDGAWMIFDFTVKVFADGELVGSGSLKNGFHLEFNLLKTQPILIVKHAFRSQKIKIPKLEIGKNYELILSYDRYWKGNFNCTPSRIIKT
jgi:hypothetical protein